MTIQIGGQQFTESEVIAAIAASNDADHTHTVTAYASLDEVSGVLQAVLHRIAALEERLPESRAGYGVTTTVEGTVTKHRVQCKDHHGETMIVTFEVPTATDVVQVAGPQGEQGPQGEPGPAATPVIYSTVADLPDASANHGAVVHVHGEGAMYFAHAGQWLKLAIDSSSSSSSSSSY